MYGLSLASYDFFDLQRFVEELERSSARAGCRILITSREALFQRWLGELRAGGREAPRCSVMRLTHDDYHPGPLFDHAVLLARSRGLAEPEAIGNVLVERVASPLELGVLIRSLPLHAGTAETQEIIAGWEGELHTKIEGRIEPKGDCDVLVLLLIAASSASSYQHEKLHSPSAMYSKLHLALKLEGDSFATFNSIMSRLSPFLALQGKTQAGSQPFEPSHSVVLDAIKKQLATPQVRTLLRQIAVALPNISPRVLSPPKNGVSSISNILGPWCDHFLVALYLLSLGVALDGAAESEAFEKLLFALIGFRKADCLKLMGLWQVFPDRLRTRFFEELQRAPQEDPWDLRRAAEFLPQTTLEPAAAWKVLELLLDEPQRGTGTWMFPVFPWAYLFRHLGEIPHGLQEKLDAWAREDPAFFVYAMARGLLFHWANVPSLWRSCLFHPSCLTSGRARERLVDITAQHWTRAPQPFRELFDFLARSPEATLRALAGSQALFHAGQHPDLARYALEASHDPDPMVGLETFRWGQGDETHRAVAEEILEGAPPGVAAEIMLELLKKDNRDEIAPWEKEALTRCERLGGGAARAAIASAVFAGKKRAHDFGYNVADSPFEEPEIVRAAWIWNHLSSRRTNPPLSDDDLKRLLQGLTQPRIRVWCLTCTSFHARELPESFQQFLSGLGEASKEASEAIRAGARRRKARGAISFGIHRLVD